MPQAAKLKAEPYQLLTEEAGRVKPGSEGLFFLPYLSGERTPHADPDARGCFIGLTLAHTRAHMVRSILEGVTYSMRESLEIFRELGVPVRQIRASGGGSRSPLWRQIQADVFGQKVVTINSVEGPAYGVALLAAVGAGAFKNIQEACSATISIESETARKSRPPGCTIERFRFIRTCTSLSKQTSNALPPCKAASLPDAGQTSKKRAAMSTLFLSEADVDQLLDMPQAVRLVEECSRAWPPARP